MTQPEREPENPSNALAAIQALMADKKASGRFTRARIDPALKFRDECEYALEIVKGSPKLMQASPDSVRECIEDVARLGLTLRKSSQQAYLVPRFIKGRGVLCTLYTSWRGLRTAAGKWGGLNDMTAQVVYANEPFELTLGTHPEVKHTVIANHQARGPLIGAYCIAYMKSGLTKVEYIDKQQIERARASSETKQDRTDNPWNKWYEEMARKTVVRRAAKHWGGSPEMDASLEVQNKYEGLGLPVDDEEPETFDTVTDEDLLAFHARLTDQGMNADKVLTRVAGVMGLENIAQLGTHRIAEANEWINKAITAHNERQRDKENP